MLPPDPISALNLIALSILATAILGLYLLPTLFSIGHRQTNWAAVFLVNLFLGWTIIGWITALFLVATSADSSMRPLAAGD